MTYCRTCGCRGWHWAGCPEDPHDWRWIEVAFGAFGWFCPHCGGMEGPRPANARLVDLGQEKSAARAACDGRAADEEGDFLV